MEVPELSLAPTTKFVKRSENEMMMMMSSPSQKLVESKSKPCSSKKRKLLVLHDHHQYHKTSVDLQLKDPLPLDWEQCLDLQSGKMYYLNRKTLRKSWNWPKEDYDHDHHQKLELELELNNINSSPAENLMINFRHGNGHGNGSSSSDRDSSSNMVALPCLNCHLLVILSKSSPSCPNCKHFHTLFPTHSSSKTTPPNTLPLLN